MFQTIPGVDYRVESSSDLTTWSTVETHYGLGQEVAVPMVHTDPPMAPPPAPPAPTEPVRQVWLIMQPATTGGIVLYWHSLSLFRTAYTFKSHHFPSLILDPAWNNQIIYTRRFGDHQFSISHPPSPALAPANVQHGPEDAAMLAAFEENLATMNQEVRDHTAAVRLVPPPAPIPVGVGKKFFRIRADWGLDGDFDQSKDWMEFAAMFGVSLPGMAGGDGSGTPGTLAADPLANPMLADADANGVADGTQLDLDQDGTKDFEDAHPLDSAILWTKTRPTRYALFNVALPDGATGSATAPIGVNSQGMVLFSSGVGCGGSFLPLDASNVTYPIALAINDSGNVLGQASFARTGAGRLSASAFWPSPMAPPAAIEADGAYASPTQFMAYGGMGFSSAFANNGAFVGITCIEADGTCLGREIWQPLPDGGFMRTGAFPVATYCADDGADGNVVWGNDPALVFVGPGSFGQAPPALWYSNHAMVQGRHPALCGFPNPPARFLAQGFWQEAITLRKVGGISATGIAISYDQSENLLLLRPTIWINNHQHTLDEVLPGAPAAYTTDAPDATVLGMANAGQFVLTKPTPEINGTASCAVAVPCAAVDAIDEVVRQLYEDPPGEEIPFTGLDDVSITATSRDPSAAGKIWIMAPIGAAAGNPVRMRIPCGPLNPLTLSAANVTNVENLASDDHLVTWLGTGDATADAPLGLNMGADNPSLSAPIGIKAMKRRQVRVTVTKVPLKRVSGQDAAGNPVYSTYPPRYLPDAGRVTKYLNKVFETQLNAEFLVTLRNADPLEFSVLNGADMNPPLTGSLPVPGDRFLDVCDDIDRSDNTDPGNPGSSPKTRSPEQDAFIPLRDPAADVNVFVVGGVLCFHSIEWVPGLGWNRALSAGVANREEREVWVDGDLFAKTNPELLLIGRPAVTDTAELERILLNVLSHEVAHVMCGYGHPNRDSGPAPLPGTNHLERLMFSGSGSTNPTGTRLVKGEWDAAEIWLSKLPYGTRTTTP